MWMAVLQMHRWQKYALFIFIHSMQQQRQAIKCRQVDAFWTKNKSSTQNKCIRICMSSDYYTANSKNTIPFGARSTFFNSIRIWFRSLTWVKSKEFSNWIYEVVAMSYPKKIVRMIYCEFYFNKRNCKDVRKINDQTPNKIVSYF